MSAAPLPEPDRDLDVARRLAAAGVPIFLAKPDPTSSTGFALPPRWQLTQAGDASLAAIDAWRPGDALCAVMGVVVDLLDVDPRNGGDAEVAGLKAAGMWPKSYARARTPSGGTHDFVARLRTGSRDNVRPGLDVKGGRDGVVLKAGRGFAFIAPTVRASKVTGELLPYVWDVEPDLDDLLYATEDDDSGADLARLVAEAIGHRAEAAPDQYGQAAGPSLGVGGLSGFDAVHSGPIRDGERHRALVSYAGRLRDRGLSYDEAKALYLRRWEDCAQPGKAGNEAGYYWSADEALTQLDDVFRRYAPAPVDLAEATFGTLPVLPPNVTPLRPEYAAPGGLTDEAEASDAALEAELRLNYMVSEQVERLRVADLARRVFAKEQQAHVEPPPLVALGDFLAVEDDDATHRIDGLWPTGGRVLLAAAFKAGKSTSVANVLRSLVDGDLFLGNFPVQPVTGRVVLIDDELDERNLRRWLREQGIRNVDKVVVVSLRGKVGTFDLLDPAVRAHWSAQLRAVDAEVVVFDCLRPVLDVLNLSEDKEAGRFLVQFDALLSQGGVSEAIVVHHTGHDGERSRGDSRLRDWPDAEWRITRLKEGDGPIDPAAPRFFAAYGRDVDVPEGRLDYDERTRRLTYVEGEDRRDAVVDRDFAMTAPLVTNLLTQDPPPLDKHGTATGWSTRSIVTALTGQASKPKIMKALDTLVERGLVIRSEGPNRALVHVLATPSTARSSVSALSDFSVRSTLTSVSDVSAPPPFKGGALTLTANEEDQKEQDRQRTDTMIETVPGLLSAPAPSDCPCGRPVGQHGNGQWITCGSCGNPWHAFGIGKLNGCPTCANVPASGS